MANNSNLRKADKIEFDEYYTEYEYIQKEINAYLEYFTSVIDWISGVFLDVESEMRGLDWGFIIL